jgi:hypothetical protein
MAPHFSHLILQHSDKKEKKILLIYKEIQSGAVAKSYTYFLELQKRTDIT